MTHISPDLSDREIKDFDTSRFQELTEVLRDDMSFSEKIDAFSAQLLELPYSNPLNSADEAEELRVPLGTYDCITLMETVYAACGSTSVASFTNRIMDIRYANGELSWNDRNHYTTDWIINNERKGYVKNITPLEGSVTLARTLSCLPGYPAREHEIRYLPRPQLESFIPQLETGDLLCFGTSLENLDVTHVGIYINKDGQPTLRNAAKSKGGVVDEALSDFLDRFGAGPGTIIVRPLERE